MVNKVDVGNRIKTLREKSNLSKELLSGFLDIGVDQLSKIEAGDAAITSDAVEELSDLFFCPMDYLLSGGKEEPEFVFVLQGLNPTVESLKNLSQLNKIAKNQFFMDDLGEVPKWS